MAKHYLRQNSVNRNIEANITFLYEHLLSYFFKLPRLPALKIYTSSTWHAHDIFHVCQCEGSELLESIQFVCRKLGIY